MTTEQMDHNDAARRASEPVPCGVTPGAREMPRVIYGPGRIERYEVQWQGILTGRWWTRRYYRRRWQAVLRAALEGPGHGRVIDHGPDDEKGNT